LKLEGFCWSLINGTRSTNDLKFRVSQRTVNDVGGMKLYSYSEAVTNQYITAVCNADFMSRYTEVFVNHTVNFQINDCKMIPIVIPDTEQLKTINSMVSKVISIKKSISECSEMDVEKCVQLETTEQDLDKLVNELYCI